MDLVPGVTGEAGLWGLVAAGTLRPAGAGGQEGSGTRKQGEFRSKGTLEALGVKARGALLAPDADPARDL
jgi:hypothetical protein